MNKPTRNILRISAAIFITASALPEMFTKPTLALQALYAVRLLCLLAWLWLLTGSRK